MAENNKGKFFRQILDGGNFSFLIFGILLKDDCKFSRNFGV